MTIHGVGRRKREKEEHFNETGDGCNPPKKSKSNEEKMFSCRLESAKNCSKDIIIRKMVVINKTKRKYYISGSESSRSIHEVIIANTPTCSCADFSKCNARVLCKHGLCLVKYVIGSSTLHNQLKSR